MSKLVLFDLPSKGRCACWSLNPWKTRLALNFKGIDYETKWLEYPDVEPTLKSYGIPPNDKSANPAAYTIPAVRMPDGKYIMDSENIAKELETLQPSPSLHLESSATKEVAKIIGEIMGPSRPIWMHLVPPNLLNPSSVEFFESTRRQRLGMSLAEYAKKEGGEKPWEALTPLFKRLGEVLRREDGPFVMGKTPSYGDFYIVSLLHFWKRIDEQIYQRAVDSEQALGSVYEASKEWLARDDH